MLLAAVDAGLIPLARAIESLTTGPAAVLGKRFVDRPVGLVEGAPARSSSCSIGRTRGRFRPGRPRSKGKNSPLLGRDLPGTVLLTLAGGRVAYEAPD